MNWFFDAEKPLMRGLSAVADLMILNVLTLLCSLPIVTAGAAITALFRVSLAMVRGEEGSLAKEYFKAFSGNFRQGTQLWLLITAGCAVLYADYLAAAATVAALRYGVAALAVLLLAVAIYAFVLLARYENTLAATVKNALLLAVGYFPRTLAMTAFCVCFWALAIGFIRYGAPILVMFGLSLPVYVCCVLCSSVLNELEKKG